MRRVISYSLKSFRIALVLPILPRYVLREVLGMYVLGVALFVILQVTDIISTTVGKAIEHQASIQEALTAFLAYLPTLMNRSLVLAIPFAILLAFSRLQRDSEIKAMQAAGTRPLRLVWPLALPFAVVAMVAFWNAATIAPAGLQKWDDTWYGIFGSAPIISEMKYTYAPPGALFYAGQVIPDSTGRRARLNGVMVQRGNETLTAQSGEWDAETKSWILEAPWVARVGKIPYQEARPVIIPQKDTLQAPPKEAKKVSNAVLRDTLANKRLSKEDQRLYQHQLAARYADPLTAIIFALAAGVLGLLIRSRVVATATVIVFVISFYVVWTIMPELARSGGLNPVLAAWVPNILFMCLALWLMWRLRR